MRAPDLFEELARGQEDALREYAELLKRWNRRVNLVARTDVDRIWEYHIAHCLLIGLRDFSSGSRIVDWGAGGGLPAIVLAICFPECEVVAVDRVEKKVLAMRAMARSLGLRNFDAVSADAEWYAGPAEIAVSRATAPLVDLWTWTEGASAPVLHCLKGGDLSDEILELRDRYDGMYTDVTDLEEATGRSEWRTKKLVTVKVDG